jgi:hypothetical protein
MEGRLYCTERYYTGICWEEISKQQKKPDNDSSLQAFFSMRVVSHMPQQYARTAVILSYSEPNNYNDLCIRGRPQKPALAPRPLKIYCAFTMI